MSGSGHPVIGGAERYTRDIAFLLRDLGYEVEFFQLGVKDFQCTYEGFKVRAFKAENGWTFPERRMDALSSDKVFYSWYGTSSTFKYPGAAISHGVWWDNPFYDERYVRTMIDPQIKRALSGAGKLVSVDTSFMNYCRGSFPELAVGKIDYIPNYVDLNKFFPQEKMIDRDYVKILYPRRLDPARGIYQAMNLAERLIEKYHHVKFSFAVDRNNETEYQKFVDWASKFYGRVEYKNYGFDEMPSAYRESDIVLIPTQFAEGTSLSCLEAMAMAKAIVTTNVGGLSDLIINNYNGILSDISEESMFNSLCELIENPGLRAKLGDNAVRVAQEFSKDRWEKQWTKIIKELY